MENLNRAGWLDIKAFTHKSFSFFGLEKTIWFSVLQVQKVSILDWLWQKNQGTNISDYLFYQFPVPLYGRSMQSPYPLPHSPNFPPGRALLLKKTFLASSKWFCLVIVILNKNETIFGTIITNNFIKKCIDRWIHSSSFWCTKIMFYLI